MAIFSLLQDPNSYVADTWDITNDEAARTYWIDAFGQAKETILSAARQCLVTDHQGLEGAIARSRQSYEKIIGEMRRRPERFKPFTLFTFDKIHQEILEENGLQDPFLKIKHQENVKACSQYKRLITAHEKLDAKSLIRVLTEGIFAGNIFDLGCQKTSQEYYQNGLDFFHTMDHLTPHPWLVDDYLPWSEFFLSRCNHWKRIVFFVDNAGPDFVLGCVPLARILAKRGATVVLASNDHPCLNDMTVPECRAVLRALAEDDPILRYLLQTRRIRLAGSGNGYPLIDFKNISETCDQAARNADLLILEGMGRAVESNWHARFRCPTLKIAMLKNEWIAKQLNGKVYDLICRLEVPKT